MGLSKLFYIVILPLTLWIFRRYVYLVYAVRHPSLLPPSLMWRLLHRAQAWCAARRCLIGCWRVTQVPFGAVNAVASAVAGPGQDADRDSLKSLMSNVTSDYHQVMHPHFDVAPARLAQNARTMHAYPARR